MRASARALAIASDTESPRTNNSCEEAKGVNTKSAFHSNKADQLLTRRQLAERWQVTQRTIHNMERKGLPRYAIGSAVRYDADEVDAFLRSRRKGPG